MKILYLTQLLPFPQDSGAKTRAFYTLKQLSAKHEITLLSFVRSTDPPEAIGLLGSICSEVHTVDIRRSRFSDFLRVLASVRRKTPILITRDWQGKMRDRCDELAKVGEFSAIHSDQIWMAPYALRFRSRSRRPTLVLDLHNASFVALSRLAAREKNPIRRLLLQREAERMRRFEVSAIREFDRVTWVSDTDLRALVPGGPAGGKNLVIPIAVQSRVSPVSRTDAPDRVTFIGSYAWPSNAEGAEWMLTQVWPGIRQSRPGLKLTLIGRGLSRRLARKASQIGGVEITGYVQDPEPYFRETAVFVAPILSGSGLRVKILDAWNWGLPVVCTQMAAEGLKGSNGCLSMADTAEDFAAAVIRISVDRNLAKRLIEGGRRLIAEEYDWRTVYRAWDEVYG